MFRKAGRQQWSVKNTSYSRMPSHLQAILTGCILTRSPDTSRLRLLVYKQMHAMSQILSHSPVLGFTPRLRPLEGLSPVLRLYSCEGHGSPWHILQASRVHSRAGQSWLREDRKVSNREATRWASWIWGKQMRLSFLRAVTDSADRAPHPQAVPL